MSTRCYIGIKCAPRDGQPGDSVRSIYSHSDGYPSYVGKLLLENYTTPEKINQLLDLGDISLLGSEIGEKHNFEDRSHPTWCRAYGRDRNKDVKQIKARKHVSVAEFLMECKEDYTYLFDPATGQWSYRNWDSELNPLTMDICKND